MHPCWPQVFARASGALRSLSSRWSAPGNDTSARNVRSCGRSMGALRGRGGPSSRAHGDRRGGLRTLPSTSSVAFRETASIDVLASAFPVAFFSFVHFGSAQAGRGPSFCLACLSCLLAPDALSGSTTCMQAVGRSHLPLAVRTTSMCVYNDSVSGRRLSSCPGRRERRPRRSRPRHGTRTNESSN